MQPDAVNPTVVEITAHVEPVPYASYVFTTILASERPLERHETAQHQFVAVPLTTSGIAPGLSMVF
jgi:hypothetical protein